MLSMLILVIGILFTIISLKYLIIPYILIAICWLSLFSILILRSTTDVNKSIWFNFAFVVSLLGALESYSYFSLENQNNKNNYRYEGGYKEGYCTQNEILGYAPSKGKQVTSKKFYKNQLIYHVVYTIGNDGLRVTPAPKTYNDDECIIFFGGSFTFGEGVNDRSSMPYIVGALQSNKVYNFGFHGYGPHQMLSALENEIIDCKPKMVIYQAIDGHVARSAGYSSWDKHGPKYVLQNGHLIYAGHFDDQEERDYFVKKIFGQLGKSYFYKKFFENTITDSDIQLFLEIVDSSRSELAGKFPDVEFHVILWDKKPDDPTHLKIRKGFNQRSIKFRPRKKSC